MSQYPTYYPQQMYTGYNPQMQMQQNPTMYMDRLSQLHTQQMQQPQMPVANQFSPLGKMVDSVEVVKATDIPMDGNMYYFPKADGTIIYGKQWLPNGTTKISTFKAVSDVDIENTTPNTENLKISIINELTDVFMDKFNDITDSLKRLEKSIRPIQVKPRKEVNIDE